MQKVNDRTASFFELALPYIQAAGQSLLIIDPNTEGADDVAGGALIYSGDIIQAVLDGQDVPPIPEYLLDDQGQPIFVGKAFSNSQPAFYLKFALPFLVIASGQLRGRNDRAATGLKYVVQVVNSVIAGRTLPAPPAALGFRN